MGTVTTKPSRSNYHTMFSPQFAYNNDSTGTNFSTSTDYAIYDKCTLSDVPSNAIITGYKVSGSCATFSGYEGSTSVLKFRLVTDYYQGSTTSSSHSGYTAISTSDHTIFSVSGKQSNYTVQSYENTDMNSAEITWMNNNLSTVLDGTQFGIRFEGRRTYLRYLTFTLYYRLPGEIYVGSNKASAVYVGSTKATAVYLGSTKIL